MPHGPYNLEMPSVAQPTHRIWAHAAVAAALLLLTPALVAAIQWGLGGSADPDMSGVLELVSACWHCGRRRSCCLIARFCIPRTRHQLIAGTPSASPDSPPF